MRLISAILIELVMIHSAYSQDTPLLKSGKELSMMIQNETADAAYFAKSPEVNIRFMILNRTVERLSPGNGDNVILHDTFEKPPESNASLSAARETAPRKGLYYCWVYNDSDPSYRVRRGFIQSTADSGIVFKFSASRNTFFAKDWQLQYVNVSTIEQVKIRRKGRIGKGILIGAGTGFFLGGILGLAGIPEYGIFEPLPAGENALAGGLIFSIPGMILGGTIGSFRIKFPIHKDQLQYERQRNAIASYVQHDF